MKRLLILSGVGATVLVLGIAVAVAATRSGGTSSRSAATVSVKRIGSAGTVLVDSKGRALYTNDQERRGMVLCTGACLAFWKPLTVAGAPKPASSLPGQLGVRKRPDGRKQVTYGGKLLYTFTLDKRGSVTGDGFKDAFGGQRFTWHVARPTNASRVTTTPPPSTTPYSYPD